MSVVASAALAVGALDSALFATQNRKRARQSLSVAAVWTLGLIFSLISTTPGRIVTVVLAALLTLGGLALLVIHMRHGIAKARVWLAPAAGVVALVAALISL